MKIFPFIITLFLLNSKSCLEDNLPKGTPNCIKDEIKKAIRAEVQTPPMQIHSFDYHAEKVFLINSPCCDQFDYIYNSNCEKICAPYGGITGKGDNRCPDFGEKATNKMLVWKDERNP